MGFACRVPIVPLQAESEQESQRARHGRLVWERTWLGEEQLSHLNRYHWSFRCCYKGSFGASVSSLEIDHPRVSHGRDRHFFEVASDEH